MELEQGGALGMGAWAALVPGATEAIPHDLMTIIINIYINYSDTLQP